MKNKFTGIVRKNKANNHKYVTVPRENPIKEGTPVDVEERDDEDNS